MPQTQVVTIPNLAAAASRILKRLDQVVVSCNEVLKAGLGDVSAKYEVALPGRFTFWGTHVKANIAQLT